jgi:flagellar protein FlaG
MNTMTNISETGYFRQFMPDGKRTRSWEPAAASFDGASWDSEVERFKNDDMSGGESRNAEAEIARLEKISVAFNKKLQFVVNHESNEITINVIDPDTDKVIKVLPPEELRRLHSKIEEAIGFLFDEKV